MVESIDDISYDYEEDGTVVRKELKKEILTRGSWATVMFLYQDLDRKSGEFGEPKISIVRFKKAKGVFRKQSGFNITNEKQARQIVSVIQNWFAGETEAETASG